MVGRVSAFKGTYPPLPWARNVRNPVLGSLLVKWWNGVFTSVRVLSMGEVLEQLFPVESLKGKPSGWCWLITVWMRSGLLVPHPRDQFAALFHGRRPQLQPQSAMVWLYLGCWQSRKKLARKYLCFNWRKLCAVLMTMWLSCHILFFFRRYFLQNLTCYLSNHLALHFHFLTTVIKCRQE